MRCLPAGVLAAGLFAGAAHGQDPAEFYKGKQVTLVVGYGTGGGYDVYARQLARHIGRHIPGNPGVVIQNMPGAGSLMATNYLYNTAPKDGLVFGTFARDMPMMGVVGDNRNVRFDPRKLTWLGSSSSYANDAYLLWVRKDFPVKALDDARKPGGPTIVLGGTAEGASGADLPIVLREVLGLNLKQILGYPDSNALYLAIERKEIDGRVVGLSATRSTRPDWLKPDSFVHVLLQFGRDTRHPDFPDVPTARELVGDDEARALLELAELPNKLSRPYAAPPGLPPERAKALQDAFIAVHKDPQYLEDAAKLQIDISPIDGPEVLRLIDRMASAPADVLARLKKLQAEAGQK